MGISSQATGPAEPLPSNHLNHGNAVSHPNQLFPTTRDKPVITTLIEIFVVVVGADRRVSVNVAPKTTRDGTHNIHGLTVATYLIEPSWLTSTLV